MTCVVTGTGIGLHVVVTSDRIVVGTIGVSVSLVVAEVVWPGQGVTVTNISSAVTVDHRTVHIRIKNGKVVFVPPPPACDSITPPTAKPDNAVLILFADAAECTAPSGPRGSPTWRPLGSSICSTADTLEANVQLEVAMSWLSSVDADGISIVPLACDAASAAVVVVEVASGEAAARAMVVCFIG